MKNFRRTIYPIFAMLVVALLSLVSVTYAWFTKGNVASVNDLTLDEYLKEQINKYFNTKTHNNNKENVNRNIQSLGNINNHKNEINNKSITNNKKSLLNSYITYNSYINIPNETKVQQNKIKQKFCSKIAYIDLPKPKHTSKNKINSSLNNTRKDFKLKFYKKNDSNTFIHMYVHIKINIIRFSSTSSCINKIILRIDSFIRGCCLA